MKKKNLPLVSVTVIAYKSADTIIETLNSIYNQTYPHIELIVSDDCSPDNTVEVCHQWIEEHKDRFVHTELITVDHNTGVSANCNRADDACNGEWIKDVAGDDILLADCIETCVNYITNNPDTIYLWGRCKAFGIDERRCKEIDDRFDYDFFKKTPKEQYEQLVFKNNCIPATSCLYNRLKLIELGIRNDERIPFIEDRPKWINLLLAGVPFSFVDKTLVLYRVSEDSLPTATQLPKNFSISFAKFYLYYQFKPFYNEVGKTEAIRRYVQAKRTITDAWYWKIANKIFKTLCNRKK